MSSKIAQDFTVFWFRRDLRIDDNHGLKLAYDQGRPVIAIFIFDSDILNSLDRNDARVSFLHQAVTELDQALKVFGSMLRVYHGKPSEVFRQIFKQHKISSVVANEDYEPYAVKRDAEISDLARAHGADFLAVKDHLIFAKADVVKDDQSPYKVFTPYSRRWLARFEAEKISTYASLKAVENAARFKLDADAKIPSLNDIGFFATKVPVPDLKVETDVIKAYAGTRDFMAKDATTKIGVRLRFGTISVRRAVHLAKKFSNVWLTELIWREFFQMILFHFPKTVDQPFDPKFQSFPWRKSESDFQRWCEGMTGYPIVDAGMRELNTTGFMHNRTRMIVGSFLCKHLLLDWRLGERYFASKLFDFELASNVGNWQWVSGCGVDAAPYFRIFNPALQTKRFDKDHEYIKRWVPEAGTSRYLEAMVDHEFARRRALIAYDTIKSPKPAGSKGKLKV
jgi:deoxyribodipyrimidine photo-lyase